MIGSTTFPLISLQPVRDERKAWTAMLLETRPAPTADDLGLIFGDFGLATALDDLPCIVSLPDLGIGVEALPPPGIAAIRLPEAFHGDPANDGALQALRAAGYRLAADVLPQHPEPSADAAGAPKTPESQNRLLLLELLSQVVNDADDHEIEATVKRDPQLSYHLLKLVNSVAFARGGKIASFGQAIALLGRRQLQRWLQLLLYTNPQGQQVSSPLLQLAATRGRLLELLAARLHPGRRELEDQAFMTGIMSLMPSLLSVPLEEILRGIHIAAAVNAALENGEGELGLLLELAHALEVGDGPACHSLVQRLNVDHMTVNACLTQALAWANNIGKEKPAA